MLFVQEIAHETFGGQLFEVLIPTLETPEPGFVIHLYFLVTALTNWFLQSPFTSPCSDGHLP